MLPAPELSSKPTSHTPLLLSIDGTGRQRGSQTDTRPRHSFCTEYYADSATKTVMRVEKPQHETYEVTATSICKQYIGWRRSVLAAFADHCARL